MATKDRRTRVIESATLNGIDFVEVANDAQTALRVHFLNAVKPSGTLNATITGGERIRSVSVNPIRPADWGMDGTHLVLNLFVIAPGDFSDYTLALAGPATSRGLDPYFSKSVFTFKARCPSDFDCQPPLVVCPPTPGDAPPIDYLAKDFLSFRQALLDFSALRYPEWVERSEADFGMMFAEALSALADDLSYTQDRIAAEAFIDTATQRRSLVRLARLVDYEPRPAVSASVLLQFDVSTGTTEIPDGALATAPGPDGVPIPFETGAGLGSRPSSRAVNPAWNLGVIRPYWFDDSQQCLRAGSTGMFVLGSGFKFTIGQSLLIETAAATSADPPIRQIVTLIDVGNGTAEERSCDPLFPPPTTFTDAPAPPNVHCTGHPNGTAVTRIAWGADDAMAADRDLTRTRLAGNLVPATHGITQPAETFVIPPTSGVSTMMPAIVRTGPNNTPDTPSLQYLYPLRTAPISWLAPPSGYADAVPEIVLAEIPPEATPIPWTHRRWLLDSGPFDADYTSDPARFSRISGTAIDAPRFEYDGDAGLTLRFGDGLFGRRPLSGTVYRATYRVGGGALGNVAADSINAVDAKVSGVDRVSNPLPATGGADAETAEQIRRRAPQAFRAVQYRAVIPADYQAAAETLPWVQRAGTVFRWTGSWPTVFTTPDPLGSEQITTRQRRQLIDLLNRYRMVGYESYVPDPKYVSLDLIITICARPDAFRGDVERAVLMALSTAPGAFFHPDNFTFGQPMELSRLEAAIQRVSGVAGVTCVRYRIRGRSLGYVRMDDEVTVGVDEIIRSDNDPSLPDRGSIKLIIEGGK